ncbi:hypothetical protein Dimus_038127 [Dionaea muscipula]
MAFKKAKPKVMGPPMIRTPVPGQKSAREEGEIDPPPSASKRPRSSDEPPPREVAAAAQTLGKLKAYATRSAPGTVETLLQGMEPSASLGHVPPKKRRSSNYSPSYPVAKFVRPNYTVTKPAPMIKNLPYPDRPLMTCEDNALAAFQAVSSATQGDINFYLNEHGLYEKDWIDRDMQTSMARLMVVAEASMRVRNMAQDRVYDKNQEIKNLKILQKGLKQGVQKYKSLHEMSQKGLFVAEENEARAKQDLVVAQRDVELLRIERDRHQRETEAAHQENERLRQELEWVQKELGEEKQRAAPVDLQAIKDAHLVGWVDEWHASADGVEWVEMSGRGAQIQGYQATLHHLASYLPSDLSKDDLWGGIPKYEGIEIDDEGNVTYTEQEVTQTEVDPSEIERLLAAPDTDTDATALATQEQSLKEALQDTCLDDEPRVNIPTSDDPVDPIDDA